MSLTQAYVVEIGGFAERAVAEKVVRAFSVLSGTAYTLDDIRLQNVSTPSVLRSYAKTNAARRG